MGRWPKIQPEPPDAALEPLAADESLHLEDLWLASACAADDDAALLVFEEEVLRPVLASAVRLDPSTDFRDELGQTLRQLLFSPQTGAPRIGSYRGRGSLLSWTRATALRCGLRLRKSRRGPQGDEAIEQASTAASPELLFIQERFRGKFQDAFNGALRGLDRRQRTLLRLHVVEGVGLEWLATANGVHRTTIVRWLASARAEVLEGTRKRLTLLLNVDRSEVESLLELVRSRIDVSIAELLRATSES